MASTLNTKINSYAIETGIELSQAYALVPSQTGTHTESSSAYWQKSGRNPVFESTVNPPNGSGSWRLLSNGTDVCYHRTNGGAIIGRFTDHDWAAGAFFKFNSFATGISLSVPFFRLNPGTTSGFEFGYKTYADNSPRQFYVRGGGAEEILVGQIELNRWYLLSARRVGTQLIYYIDGQSVSTQTRTSSTLQSEFGWGTTQFYEASMNVSNIFVGSSSVITPVVMTDIYLTGLNLTPTNATPAADPMTASATAGPGSQRLQVEIIKGIGLLHKKINSYAIENGISFDQAFATPPTQTGTIQENSSQYWQMLGRPAVYEPTVGPPGGNGSWKFVSDNSLFSRLRNNGGALLTLSSDGNYSLGFWAKASQLRQSSDYDNAVVLFALQPNTTTGFSINVTGGATPTPYKISLTAGGYLSITDITMNTVDWYYFAVTKNGTNLNLYVNNQLVDTRTNMQNATSTVIGFGDNAAVDTCEINISNFYYAPTSVIGTTEIAEIWDVGSAQGLTKLSSNVNNVTTSYNLIRGIRFNENYKDPYTQTGYAPQTTEAEFSLTGNAPVWVPGDEGQTEGGWSYSASNTVTSRTRDAGYIPNYFEYDTVSGYTQSDWSFGFWVKLNSWNNQSFTTIATTETTQEGFRLSYGIGNPAVTTGSTLDKKQFRIDIGGGTAKFFGEDLDLKTGEWYYIALRRNGSSAYVYLNGFLITTFTSLINYPTVNLPFLTIGDSIGRGQSFTISNLYLATNSVIGPEQIKNIWLSRKTLNVNKLIFPLIANGDMLGQPQKGPTAYASAEMVHPLIAATIGDSTNITTSTTASALMVNPVILTGQWILVANQQLGTANAQLVFPFNIETNLDRNISVLPATATITFVEPRVAERPFLASALFVNPTLDIDENYFQKVMDLNPIIYINDGQQNPINYGSLQQDSYYNQSITFDVNSTQEMQAVNNTKSWKVAPYTSNNQYALFRPSYDGTEWANKLTELYTSRTLSIEFWYYSVGTVKSVSLSDPNNPLSPLVYQSPIESGPLFSDGITNLAEVYGGYSTDPNTPNKMLLIGERMSDYNVNSPNATATWRDYPDANPERNDWNHVVITYEPQVDFNRVRRYIYLNGAIVSNLSLQLTQGSGLTTTPTNDLLSINVTNAPEGPYFGGRLGLSGSQNIRPATDVMFDEFAYYPVTLTASQVLDHYAFVKAQSPDENVIADSMEAIATFGQANILPVQNFEYEADPVTALGSQIPSPTVVTGFDKVVVVSIMSADASIFIPEHSHGSTIAHTEFVAYAESRNAFHLNSIYYDYVQANIAPYRYVTFDSAAPYFDYGIDNDYTVANFTVGGTVVNPDFGINGKSVKTTGAYTNPAITFKESEHFDNWGTGNNSWHSSFWMQRALDDNSTGLRILWNLNGAYDNQNIILYHYNSKLHLQVNNQVGAPITITTVNNINPFDFGLHHFVINFHHNNNKNHAYLYMDGLLIADQDINTYMVDVINNPIHVGANDEANNFPRLGIGGLITPFAFTALPVVPTNTSVYYDEIYWDKNQILAAGVAALFNTMPNKVMAVIFGAAMTASAQSVMASLTTTANYIADPMLANATGDGHSVSAVLNNVETVAPMTAFAEILNAVRRDNVTISAAFMLASSSIAGAGTPRIVRPAFFTANAELANRRVLTGGILVNGIKIFDAQSAWVQYIKITNEGSLLPMDGVR